MKSHLGLAMAISSLAAAMPAEAVTVQFEGTRYAVDAPGPQSPRCGTRATSNIRHNPPTSISTGLSNLGAFTPTLSHCVQLPLSALMANIFDLGEFSYDFGSGNILTGTYSGTLTFLAPGQFSVTQTHIVTGGLGDFLGATGTFSGAGTLSFPMGRPTINQTFSGTLNLPAVPEPGTWLMLIAGFGAIGGAMRRRNALGWNGRRAMA